MTPFVDKIIEDRPYGSDGIVLPYRFSEDKIEMLKLQYEKNSEWTSKMRKELAKSIGLEAQQVYKWYWSYKRKMNK